MTRNSLVLYGILCGLTQLNQTFTTNILNKELKRVILFYLFLASG
jgi:hypothetical protein